MLILLRFCPHSQTDCQLFCQRVSLFFKTNKVSTPYLSATVIIIKIAINSLIFIYYGFSWRSEELQIQMD
ncbi:hypothetical protein AH332_14235 [Salmonella enterica subsp. salamae]|nr:hypothetical protein [Salmonella enterica subsp. salamae]EDW4021182.1 hypothetical protein [Salmonella enterica subsp. salamae]